MNEEELKALVARVTKQVVNEVKLAEEQRGISVRELADHAKALGGGDISAWKITYDTKGVDLNTVADPASISAWKISYDTKRAIDDGSNIIE
jgi:hypothetical protein